MAGQVSLAATPLNGIHRSMGARMVDFGGWDMPVQYSGIIDEHHAVRKAVGLFDVSHMGEIEIHGPEAAQARRISSPPTPLGKLKIGQAQYSGLLYEHGGFVDDILVHKRRGRPFFPLRERFQPGKGLRAHSRLRTASTPKSNSPVARYAQLAIQGPRALATLQKLTSVDLHCHPLLLVH